MKKLFTILILAILILLGIGLFYFYPIPQAVRNVTQDRELERCIYSGGIGYFTKSSPGAVLIFYSGQGENLCSTGGHGIVFNEPEGPCAQKMCFSIYDN